MKKKSWSCSGAGLEVGRAAVVDLVGGGGDHRARRLAEDLGQPHDRRGAGGDQVLERLAGADRRQLVGVADEDDVGRLGQPAEQHLGQAQVQHRGLVDDHQVDRQRPAGPEGRLAPRHPLEHPVDRLRLVAGRLFQPPRRAPGRGAEGDRRVRGFRLGDDLAGASVLPTPGPPVRTETRAANAARTAAHCSSVSLPRGLFGRLVVEVGRGSPPAPPASPRPPARWRGSPRGRSGPRLRPGRVRRGARRGRARGRSAAPCAGPAPRPAGSCCPAARPRSARGARRPGRGGRTRAARRRRGRSCRRGRSRPPAPRSAGRGPRAGSPSSCRRSGRGSAPPGGRARAAPAAHGGRGSPGSRTRTGSRRRPGRRSPRAASRRPLPGRRRSPASRPRRARRPAARPASGRCASARSGRRPAPRGRSGRAAARPGRAAGGRSGCGSATRR